MGWIGLAFDFYKVKKEVEGRLVDWQLQFGSG